jgi:hypothetical protein
MKRDVAEETSKMMNDRKWGLTSSNIAEYFEGNDGGEKNPHGTVVLNTLAGVYETFAGLKENMVSLIGISRLSGVGHSATVVRLGGELMIYDAQLETLTPNIANWLDSESASFVEVVLKINKRVHCRDETHISVKKTHDDDEFNKRQKIEQPLPRWKVQTRRLKRQRSSSAFVKEMTDVGFVNWL